MYLVLFCASLVIGRVAYAAPSELCDSCSETIGNDGTDLLQMRSDVEVLLQMSKHKVINGNRKHEYRHHEAKRLHRFCDGGKEVDLCGFPHYEFSAWAYDNKTNLETYHKDSEPQLVHGHACLEVWDLQAETEQECRNYERAFAILHDQKWPYANNISSYEVPPGLPGIPDAFWMMGTMQAGTAFVMQEFVHNFYRIDKMGLKSGDTLFDIGGNIGCFSVVAAKTFPGLKVVTFEANPVNFLLAKHNINANDLEDRVTVVGRAINGDGSDLEVHYDMANPGGSNGDYRLIRQSSDLEGNAFIVPGTTMKAAVMKYLPGNESFAMKLDCEGCEHFAVPYLSTIEGRIKAIRGEIHKMGEEEVSRARQKKTLDFFEHSDPMFVCTWCSDFFGK
eukprot:gnl/TRDRNA2_/TRDRNA2_178845_c0_seq1.p1 gnl/TRDRNA2_/TRDRNA2_178845_c0~~gnl/TRDRNA2_/TRDRNA2_178845_c0_seq1.p1  ORF type:complete len:391 (+),score=64.21 gnl/TRDRNA2_/TRDRNA2_178845_c0_seq1:104-1276(+)